MNRLRSIAALCAVAAWLPIACAQPSETKVTGRLEQRSRELASELDVPGDLVLAIAAVEGGLRLPPLRQAHADEHVPVAGILELRHGAFDSLARGAALVGANEETLRIDTELGTRAGVAVLRELGDEVGATGDDLTSWRGAVAKLSGYRDAGQQRDYVARVYGLLRRGGELSARGGERITLAPHPELGEVELKSLETPPAPQEPEFDGATWVSTSCSGKCDTDRGRAIDAILIHDTEGGWDASMATLQHDPGKSVHYLIDHDGSRVVQFIPESYTGWHAGNYCWNSRSIGIEHVGFASETYANGLYEKSAELVLDILARHPNIPVDRDHIIGHYQVPSGASCKEACSEELAVCEESPDFGGSGNHRDPGYNFQWCQYMERIGGHCRCEDAWSNFNCTTDGAEMWRCQGGKVEKQVCQGGCNVMPVGTPDQCVANADPGVGGGGSGGAPNLTAGAAGASGSATAGASSGGGMAPIMEPPLVVASAGTATVPSAGAPPANTLAQAADSGSCSIRSPGTASTQPWWLLGLLLIPANGRRAARRRAARRL